jgi:hypothetical protein
MRPTNRQPLLEPNLENSAPILFHLEQWEDTEHRWPPWARGIGIDQFKSLINSVTRFTGCDCKNLAPMQIT